MHGLLLVVSASLATVLGVDVAAKVAVPQVSATTEYLQTSVDLATQSAAVGQCDIEADGPICLSGGAKVVLPAAKVGGLVAHYTFDEVRPLDQSGNRHNAVGQAEVGMPAGGGSGASAFFQPGNFLTIPHAPGFDSADFAYSGWIFAMKNQEKTATKWCPIFRKGIRDGGSEVLNAPAFLIDEGSRKMRVVVSTDQSGGDGEYIQSNARLRPNQWMHFAIVRADAKKRTRLYINGILDATAQSAGSVRVNDMPLYVGGDPWSADCQISMYVDEFKVYNRVLSPDEISAEAGSALGGIEPHFVRLSCVDCDLKTAKRGCTKGYHVCTSMEIHTAAYAVSRTMGWLEKGAHLWTLEDSTAVPEPQHQGLGMCCEDEH